MKRVFLILALVGGVSGVAWALRHHLTPPAPATPAASTTGETPSCCQKAPSRTSLLQAKPTAP